jgi:hypothetical protein
VNAEKKSQAGIRPSVKAKPDVIDLAEFRVDLPTGYSRALLV